MLAPLGEMAKNTSVKGTIAIDIIMLWSPLDNTWKVNMKDPLRESEGSV